MDRPALHRNIVPTRRLQALARRDQELRRLQAGPQHIRPPRSRPAHVDEQFSGRRTREHHQLGIAPVEAVDAGAYHRTM